MNREDILRIAKECGFLILQDGAIPGQHIGKNLERFANRMMAEGVKMAAEKCGDIQGNVERGIESSPNMAKRCEIELHRMAKQLEKEE